MKALSASGESNPAQLQRTLEQAVRFYLGPDRRGPGWVHPKFLEVDEPAVSGMDLRLAQDVWRDLSIEAERQGVNADSLLQHAALYFAAAGDGGRLTSRILEELESDQGGD